jgi:hypothetical protein
MTDQSSSMELAIADLTRQVQVGFAKVDGQLAVLLQRTEAMERRADQQARAIEDLQDRLGKVERDAVTRGDLDRRSGRTIALLSVVVAAVGVLSSAGTAIIQAAV